MWLRTSVLIWTAIFFVSCDVVLGSVKCYDCNYDPELLEVGDNEVDWAGKSDRGFPRCALQRNEDLGLVADTVCQGTCFIRKDYNGMVYRGCADSWNLPYHVDVSTNCTRHDDAVWWFCTGSHCNRGGFGDDHICPGNYYDDEQASSEQHDVEKSYGEDNQVYTRVDGSASRDEDVYNDIRYGDIYDEQLYTYDTADNTGDPDEFDPYKVLESGWQSYRNDLEPKSARSDDGYQEPRVVPNPYPYGENVETAYTYDPPQPIENYPAPYLVNSQFEEHYRSLVPGPGSQTQNGFKPPGSVESPNKKGYNHENVKSWQPNAYHKSWEGDDFSVSYDKKAGENPEHVKSTYAYTDHSKSGYVQQQKSVKSHQPVKSVPVKSFDGGQTQSGYQPPGYNPHSKSSYQPTKSVKSAPPPKSVPQKSVKSLPPLKSSGYKSIPAPPQIKSYDPPSKSYQPPNKSYQQPSKSQKSHQLPQKSYQPSSKSYQPSTKSYKLPSIPPTKSYEPPVKSYEPPQKSYQPSKKSHQPPPKSYQPPQKSHQPPQKSYQPPQKSHQPPQKSHQPPQKSHQPPQKSHQPPQKSFVPPQKSYEPPQKSYEPPQKSYEPPQKSHKPPQKSYEPPQKSYEPPQKSHQPPQKSHELPPKSYEEASIKKSHNPPLPPLPPPPTPVHIKSAVPVKTHVYDDVVLPDIKSADFGDFWYEHYYRGDKAEQNAVYEVPPISGSNPCDGDCSRNPSGLYPHPNRDDWFIQCGVGMGSYGDYCVCCKPNYLRCPIGTTFDVTTRVCSIVVESEYGSSYKPIY